MAAWSGIPTVVAPATDHTAVARALDGGDVGTWVDPRSVRLPARKLWIAFGQPAEGTVTIDAGAAAAILTNGRSLLPVGVIDVHGTFGVGAALEVLSADGQVIAKGITRIGSSDLRRVAGMRSDVAGGEVVHRDDLVPLLSQEVSRSG
jgi:glutamate 5-kinase